MIDNTSNTLFDGLLDEQLSLNKGGLIKKEEAKVAAYHVPAEPKVVEIAPSK